MLLALLIALSGIAAGWTDDGNASEAPRLEDGDVVPGEQKIVRPTAGWQRSCGSQGIMTNRALVLRVALVAIAIGLVTAACVRESDENANEGANPSNGIAVEVRITDDGIALPDEIPSGPALFEVTNNGTVVHGFAIEGVDEQLAEMRVDQLETITVDLEPGTYIAYSPVGDDRENGLEAEFTVVEGDDEDNRDPADAGVGPSDQQAPLDDEGI